MKGWAVLLVPIAVLLAACGPAATPRPVPVVLPATFAPLNETLVPPTVTSAQRTLTVFAAASLTNVFTEVGQNFEAAHPGVSVALNFAGSQTLSTQLTQGAAADVFASANHAEMDRLVSDDLIEQETIKDFLTNRLVVLLPKDNPANVQTLPDLARSGLKIVLADATVPAGKYARQIIDNMSKDASFGGDFKNKVLANVVSNEIDVKQVVAKVQLGEADAGIVYISDAVAAPELKTIEIPSNFNVVSKYPIATLTNASQPELALDFVTYILSADGQAILKKWGFTPITP